EEPEQGARGDLRQELEHAVLGPSAEPPELDPRGARVAGEQANQARGRAEGDRLPQVHRGRGDEPEVEGNRTPQRPQRLPPEPVAALALGAGAGELGEHPQATRSGEEGDEPEGGRLGIVDQAHPPTLHGPGGGALVPDGRAGTIRPRACRARGGERPSLPGGAPGGSAARAARGRRSTVPASRTRPRPPP